MISMIRNDTIFIFMVCEGLYRIFSYTMEWKVCVGHERSCDDGLYGDIFI